MKKMTIRAFLTFVCVLQQFAFLPYGLAQQKSSPQSAKQAEPASRDQEALNEEVTPPGQVVIDGRPVLNVYETVTARSPEERAQSIEQRLVAVARSRASVDSIRVESREAWSEIFLGQTLIMAVTDGDARMAGKSRQQLVFEDVESIRQAIQEYRREHGWPWILRGALYAILATLALLFALWLIQGIRVSVRDRVQKSIYTIAHSEQRSAWHASIAYLGPLTLGLGAIVRWIFILGLMQAYLTVTLGFFPYTHGISLTVSKWIFSQLAFLARSAVDYLPNLLVLTVIGLITNYGIRLLRLIFGQIEKGELKIRGFYPDWAEPTEKLIRMLVLVLALIVAFPYLPGAKSPAFQGISIFLGLLLSLGSSSAVANAIAGIILTYMRSFLVGDWVQIGDTIGQVTEKTLLVTRVLTPKAELITIPNATVMSGSVKNYSVEAKKTGVIFHTQVTIGYDAPWRTVHQLLVSAALATEHVLQQPVPFVLQKGLDDFYVAYELNAYTDVPRLMLDIYSALHQNIQDKFNEAGVEICSPHFSSLRDGNTIAIPEQYIQPDYKAAAFRVKPVEANGQSEAVPNSITRSSTAD
jgi:small-conductance mechanosensitive channel